MLAALQEKLPNFEMSRRRRRHGRGVDKCRELIQRRRGCSVEARGQRVGGCGIGVVDGRKLRIFQLREDARVISADAACADYAGANFR